MDSLKEELPSCETAAVAAVEYIDRKTMDLIEERKPSMSKIKELPDIEQEITDMVYLEIQGQEEGIEEIAEMPDGKKRQNAEAILMKPGQCPVRQRSRKMHAFRQCGGRDSQSFH